MGIALDISVYFVADPSLCEGRDVADVVEMAARGGVTLVQYRDKTSSRADIIRESRRVMDVLKPFGIPLLINDYVDIAAEIGADGAHIGQGDMSPVEARRILGAQAIIGQTAFEKTHFDTLRELFAGTVDYTGTGPFYPTKTDKGKPVLGPERFTELVRMSPVPVVGIGGITPDTARPVFDAGAHGVAMIRSISASSDPEATARDFVRVVSDVREGRAA